MKEKQSHKELIINTSYCRIFLLYHSLIMNLRDEAISIDDRMIDYIKYAPGGIWPKALKKTIFQRGKSAEKMAPSAIKLPDVIAKSMKSFRQQRKETPLFPHCEKMDNDFHIAYKDNITYFIVEDGDKIYIAVSFKDVPFLLFCCDGSAFRAHFCDESGSTRIEIAPDPLLVHTIFHLRDEKPVHISYKDAFDSENLFEIKLVE